MGLPIDKTQAKAVELIDQPLYSIAETILELEEERDAASERADDLQRQIEDAQARIEELESGQ